MVAMDATRTPIDYLCRCVEAAIKAGATTINLPDTVGYATPEEYAQMFRTVRERVPNADKAIFSVHCHNDLGLAVANSLAGVAAARGRSNAPSTASASAPAMPRSKKS
jgi:2-isopropylmalate synthase